jgi:hypothetical protein
MGKKDKHYVNGNLMLIEFQDWKAALNKNPDTKIPHRLAKKIKLIVDRIGTSHKFSNYTYLSEMKSLALYNIIKYLKNFDPDKSPYIVTYISKITYNAFIKVIKDEKKIQNKKKKYLNYKFSLSGHNQSNKNSSDIDRFNDFEPPIQEFSTMKIYKKNDKNPIIINSEEEYEKYCEQNYNIYDSQEK